MPQLILASTSPRRKALLEQLGLEFDIVAPDYEEHMDPSVPTRHLATVLALGKARAVSKLYPDAVVIGADTFISYENTLLGKPQTEEAAATMLAFLSGSTHTVLTGYAVLHGQSGTEFAEAIETEVTLRQLSDLEIDSYIATGEPLDKAGAYALQGLGGALVERVNGDVSSVIGLPLAPLSVVLRRFGVPVFGA